MKILIQTTIFWYKSQKHHPYIIISKWGLYFLPFFIIFSFGSMYFIQLELDCLQNQLASGYDTLSATSDALLMTKDSLKSLANDFAKVNEAQEATLKNLQNVSNELNPICKQFLTGKFDLLKAYIKIGGISPKK